jgi:hypothetical protein
VRDEGQRDGVLRWYMVIEIVVLCGNLAVPGARVCYVVVHGCGDNVQMGGDQEYVWVW